MKNRSLSKPLSILLIIVVAFSIMFIPVSGSGLAVQWDTTTITWRIATPDTCIDEFLLPRLSAIRDAFSNWHKWLPIVSFTQVQSGERITISCYNTLFSKEGWGGATWGYPNVNIALWLAAFSPRYDAQGGRNIVAHEIGHALGLLDSFAEGGIGGTCTLMDYCFLSQTIVILQPTQAQLNELNAMFSTITTTTTTTTSTTSSSSSSQTTHTTTSNTYGVSVGVSPAVWPQSILTFGQPPTPTVIVLSAIGWFGIIATLIVVMLIPIMKRRRV